MNFIEIYNDGLYTGLSALQNTPKYQYSIHCNGIDEDFSAEEAFINAVTEDE